MRRRIQGRSGSSTTDPFAFDARQVASQVLLSWDIRKKGVGNTLHTRWRSLQISHFSKEAHEEQQQQEEEEEEKMKPPGRHDAKLPRPRRSPRASGKQRCLLCVVETWTVQRQPVEGSSSSEQLGLGGCRWWLRYSSILYSVCVASPSHTLCPRIECRALPPSHSLFCWLRRRAVPSLTNARRLVRITLAKKGERWRLGCASLSAGEAANPSEPVHVPSRPKGAKEPTTGTDELACFPSPDKFRPWRCTLKCWSRLMQREILLLCPDRRVCVLFFWIPPFQGERGRFLFFFFSSCRRCSHVFVDRDGWLSSCVRACACVRACG